MRTTKSRKFIRYIAFIIIGIGLLSAAMFGCASKPQAEYEFHVMTDDNAPIGCETGINKEGQMDALEMLAELEKLQGFIFPADSGVKLRFSFSPEPEDVYVRYISESHWQEEYPYENQRINVPEEPGVYNIFVDIGWEGDSFETAFFSVTVSEREDVDGGGPENNAPTDKTTITFPVSEEEKTEFNAEIYEIEPFDLFLELPDGWSLGEWPLAGGYDFISVWSRINFFNEKKECVGVIGYNTYEIYEGAENNPMAIYNQIALGNNYQFNIKNSYIVVNETDSGTTATADVTYSANINDGVEKTNKGIVSYNKDFLVYIAAEFDSTKVTDEQIVSIAESVQILR